MESRIKKLFHRKKDTVSEASLQQTQRSKAARSSPALRTSLYDTVPIGDPPQTGSYPIKADDSSIVLQKRKSSQRNRGPSDPIQSPFNRNSVSQPYNGKSIVMGPGSPRNDLHSTVGTTDQLHAGRSSEGDSRAHQKQYDTPLSTDFSTLSLKPKHSSTRLNPPQVNDSEPTPLSDEWHRIYKGGKVPNSTSNLEEAIEEIATPVQAIQGRTVFNTSEQKKEHHKNQPPYLSNAAYKPRRSSLDDEAELTRNSSIPRKHIGTYSKVQESTRQSSSLVGQNKLRSNAESFRSASNEHGGGNRFEKERTIESLNDTKKPGADRRDAQKYSAEHIVDKAHGDSVTTEVTEKWAPAVVHETIHQDVHHMREELVTLEVHNHDVYHRILPIIDVEVLPPRHFLPVEGGGLVEISAGEAPGRGRNWVIAETASKIPSDQAAPKGANRFSARKFPGTEGDSREYLTREGVKITEETWVHPPDLETGGRDTGQTWPMMFGDAEPKKDQAFGYSKIGKKKNSRKPSVGHSIPVERMH